MEQAGDRIRKARLALGLTQPQLAKLVGVSKGTVSMWETNITSPKGTNLLNLAACLKLHPKYIMSGETPSSGSGPKVRASSDQGDQMLDEVSMIMLGLSKEDQKAILALLRAWPDRDKT